jgi:hypothetical protein
VFGPEIEEAFGLEKGKPTYMVNIMHDALVKNEGLRRRPIDVEWSLISTYICPLVHPILLIELRL